MTSYQDDVLQFSSTLSWSWGSVSMRTLSSLCFLSFRCLDRFEWVRKKILLRTMKRAQSNKLKCINIALSLLQCLTELHSAVVELVEIIYFYSIYLHRGAIFQSSAHLFDLWEESRRSGNDVTFPSLSRPISVQHKDKSTRVQTDAHKHTHTRTCTHYN